MLDHPLHGQKLRRAFRIQMQKLLPFKFVQDFLGNLVAIDQFHDPGEFVKGLAG